MLRSAHVDLPSVLRCSRYQAMSLNWYLHLRHLRCARMMAMMSAVCVEYEYVVSRHKEQEEGDDSSHYATRLAGRVQLG